MPIVVSSLGLRIISSTYHGGVETVHVLLHTVAAFNRPMRSGFRADLVICLAQAWQKEYFGITCSVQGRVDLMGHVARRTVEYPLVLVRSTYFTVISPRYLLTYIRYLTLPYLKVP